MKKMLAIALLTINVAANAQILSYTSFRSPGQVDADINRLVSTYPALASAITIGTTEHGMPVRALRISNSLVNDPSKGDVVFMSLMHAREWISVETLLYIADRMLDEYDSNGGLKADMDRLQIWFIPVCNPEGYDFSATTNRYWRKNRTKNIDESFGVDINRNWGFQWGLASGAAVGKPMEDTYPGTAAFSEPETIIIRDFFQGLTNYKASVSFHSYSQLYLRPWAYTNMDPAGESTLRSIAQRNIRLIKGVHGAVYKDDISYTSSGETSDYFWHKYRAAAFSPELRPATYAAGHFSPPPSEILPCAQENYPAALALVRDAGRPHIWIADHASDTGIEPFNGYAWESPDIWTVPQELNQGSTVELHVRVHNNGLSVDNATVEVYYTDPNITVEFPSANTKLIEERVVTLFPGVNDLTFHWITPIGPNAMGERHWCVGAVVKHDTDMPLTTIVNRSSNIACHNFNLTTIIDGAKIQMLATNTLAVPAELRITFNENEIPKDWRLELPESATIQQELKITASTVRKGKLLKTKGILLEPGQTIKIPVQVHFEKAPGKDVLVRVRGDLIPLVAGKRIEVGNGYTYQVKAKK